MINIFERTVTVRFIYLLVFVEISVYDTGVSIGDRKKKSMLQVLLVLMASLMFYYTDNVIGIAVSQEH